MQGWILDIAVDYQRSCVWLWTKGVDGRIRRTRATHTPAFYVQAPDRILASLSDIYSQEEGVDICADQLAVHPGGIPQAVLKVLVADYRRLSPLASELDALLPPGAQLFNVDVDIALAFQVHREVFPLALVDVEGLQAYDRIDRLYYTLPPLTSASLDVVFEGQRLQQLVLEGEHLRGSETMMLEQVQDLLADHDPDILLTPGGDRFLPRLYERALHLGVGWFTLGREPELQPFAEERSYQSYGRMMYTPPRCLLTGRLHLDEQHSFFYHEAGLPGLCEISRLSRIPPQQLSRVTPGTAITAMQIALALHRGMGVPWKKNTPEALKSAYTLLLADRGGLIYDPPVGIYEDVYELDFSSLYPFIMLNHNISPETVLCSCCPESSHRVPLLDYPLCQRHRGLIPTVLEPLVRRRVIYKQHLRRENNPVYRGRSRALKWVLVTCFGYTGYRNARFGRIECHEAINAFARETLLTATHIAEEHGFRVLHGIIDSLWLTGRGDIQTVCKEIEKEVAIPLEVAEHYKWLVLLPTRGTGAGALNRYYGARGDGSVKIRGLETRRSDTPPLVRQCQEDMVAVLAVADDAGGVVQQIPRALVVLRQYVEQVRAGVCRPEDLVITRRVTKPLREYQQRNESAACLWQLEQQGIVVHPGQLVRYVVTDATTLNPRTKVQVWPAAEPQNYDREKYVKLLCTAAESLLLPFGYTHEVIHHYLDGLTSLATFHNAEA